MILLAIHTFPFTWRSSPGTMVLFSHLQCSAIPFSFFLCIASKSLDCSSGCRWRAGHWIISEEVTNVGRWKWLSRHAQLPQLSHGVPLDRAISAKDGFSSCILTEWSSPSTGCRGPPRNPNWRLKATSPPSVITTVAFPSTGISSSTATWPTVYSSNGWCPWAPSPTFI
jgi:hypothetical protein